MNWTRVAPRVHPARALVTLSVSQDTSRSHRQKAAILRIRFSKSLVRPLGITERRYVKIFAGEGQNFGKVRLEASSKADSAMKLRMIRRKGGGYLELAIPSAEPLPKIRSHPFSAVDFEIADQGLEVDLLSDLSHANGIDIEFGDRPAVEANAAPAVAAEHASSTYVTCSERRKRRWSPEDDEELQSLHCAGHTDIETAQRLGRSIAAVQVRLSKQRFEKKALSGNAFSLSAHPERNRARVALTPHADGDVEDPHFAAAARWLRKIEGEPVRHVGGRFYDICGRSLTGLELMRLARARRSFRMRQGRPKVTTRAV